MLSPYDWPILRDWLVWYIDLFLTTHHNDGPWPEYRRLTAQQPLDRGRLEATDNDSREVVLYVTDIIHEPCYEAEIRYLTRCREKLANAASAAHAVRELAGFYRDEFG
jgi:hypothetical protein